MVYQLLATTYAKQFDRLINR